MPSIPLGESLFAIEAWVPETRIKALYGLLSGFDIDCEEVVDRTARPDPDLHGK